MGWLLLLVELIDTGAQFLLVGGYAVAHHGHPRATKDIDVWVRPGPDNADLVIAALRGFGAPLGSLGVTRDDKRAAGRPQDLADVEALESQPDG